MLSYIMNAVASFIAWADEKLNDPDYLKVLLGFWIAIGLCGAFLVAASFYRYNVVVLSVGLTDLFLALVFGLYYAFEMKDLSNGKHHKAE